MLPPYPCEVCLVQCGYPAATCSSSLQTEVFCLYSFVPVLPLTGIISHPESGSPGLLETQLAVWCCSLLSDVAACLLMVCSLATILGYFLLVCGVLGSGSQGQVQGDKMKVTRLLSSHRALSPFLEVSGSIFCLPDQLVTLKDCGS